LHSSGALFLVAMLFAFVSAGCRTSEPNFSRIINEPAPLPSAVRDKFGVLGLLPLDTLSAAELSRPANRLEAIVPVGGKAFGRVRDSTRWEESDGERFNHRTGEYETHPRVIEKEFNQEVASLAFSSLAAGLVGVVGGLFAGVPEAEIQRSEASLRLALAERPLEAGVHEQMVKLVRRHATNHVVLSSADAALLNLASATNRNLAALAGRGLDSVLWVRVDYQRFDHAKGVNPPMTFASGVSLQVLRVSDGALLHTSFLDYRGRRKKFTEWAAQDAKSFRAELSRASQFLGAAAVEKLFAPEAIQ
jgi:hypothetical protein